MKRAFLIVGLLALGLFGLDSLVARSGDAWLTSDYLRPLLSAEEREALEVAAVSIRLPGSEVEHLYVREEGNWRCATVYGATALKTEVESLIGELVTTFGELVAEDARSSAYGLGEAERCLIRLHGPALDAEGTRQVLCEFELGASLEGLAGGRSFARRLGSGDILEIDADPRARLSVEPGERLPPLLDQRLLSGEWPERGEGLQRVFLDYTNGPSLELRSRSLGPAPAPNLPAPREWIVIDGDRRLPCIPFRIGAWQSFLYHVPYHGLSDPAAAERRGLDEPQATITLLQLRGEPIELVVGRSAPTTGATFVLNKKTGLLCLLSLDEVKALLATVEGFASSEIENPWESWLPK